MKAPNCWKSSQERNLLTRTWSLLNAANYRLIAKTENWWSVWSLNTYHLFCLLIFKPGKHAFSWFWQFKNWNVLDLKSTNTVSTPSTSSASWVFWGHEPTWSTYSWHGSYLIRKLLKFAGKVLDLETMGGGILDYCWLRRCHFVWIQVYRTPEDLICFGLILWVPSGLRTDDLLGNQMLLKFFLCGWSTWWILISMYMCIYIYPPVN